MESVHDIYAAGSTARPLAVGDWDDEEDEDDWCWRCLGRGWVHADDSTPDDMRRVECPECQGEGTGYW